MLNLVQILVRSVHAAVEPALLDVEALHHFPILAALLTFPNLLEGMSIEVANTKAIIKQMRRASKHPSVSHRIDPKVRRSSAFVISMALSYFLGDGVMAVDDLEVLGG